MKTRYIKYNTSLLKQIFTTITPHRIQNLVQHCHSHVKGYVSGSVTRDNQV